MLHQQKIPERSKKPSLSKKRFPSPATDHLEDRLNLHDHLIHNEAATFFCRIRGRDEEELGLKDGDLLIVDRSLAYKHHSLVVAIFEGEQRVCRLWNKGRHWSLQFGDNSFHHLKQNGESQNILWGVVSHVVHSCL
jgi:DNA polymerase V